jgi:uncharacterized protein YyaL (SSP411 family)
MPNQLINESSLYLQQHAHNPVDWRPWSEEVFDRAKEEDKPVFVSIGYSSCHWCHVMEHESFENQETANYLNEHFLCIKVDREELPDVDSFYMDAVQMMSGQGGWPLNVFVTPDKKPFWGGTYFPPQPVQGRASFMQILEQIHKVWEEKKDSALQQSEKLTDAISSDMMGRLSEYPIDESLVKAGIQNIKKQYEPEFGGFSTAPKFPHFMTILNLFRAWKRFGDEEALSMALKSLNAMLAGGIYDQIGGGIHRYSTDQEWLAPHFEKMLYDQAQLLITLAEAYEISGNEIYKRAANEALDCLNKKFRNKDGMFGSALDADTNGEEGLTYVWTKSELKDVLNEEEFEQLDQLFDIDEGGNWEGNIIPRFKKTEEISEKGKIAGTLEKLLKIRDERQQPGKDTKMITAWNALLLKGFIAGAQAFQDDLFHQAAMELATALSEIQLTNETGAVHRLQQEGTDQFLEDHAVLASAFAEMYTITGDGSWIQKAEKITDRIRSEFYDADKHAFFTNNRERDSILGNRRDLFDNAQPSAQSLAVEAFLSVGRLLADQNLYRLGEAVVLKTAELSKKYTLSVGWLFQQAQWIEAKGYDVVIVGKSPEKPKAYTPFDVAIHPDKQKPQPDWVKEKNLIHDSEFTAYPCTLGHCESPISFENDWVKFWAKR